MDVEQNPEACGGNHSRCHNIVMNQIRRLYCCSCSESKPSDRKHDMQHRRLGWSRPTCLETLAKSWDCYSFERRDESIVVGNFIRIQLKILMLSQIRLPSYVQQCVLWSYSRHSWIGLVSEIQKFYDVLHSVTHIPILSPGRRLVWIWMYNRNVDKRVDLTMYQCT
jgi:hypothetical protein